MTSTAGDATLTCRPEPRPGTWSTATFSLPRPCRPVLATPPNAGTASNNVGSSASPLNLLTWNGPVSNDSRVAGLQASSAPRTRCARVRTARRSRSRCPRRSPGGGRRDRRRHSARGLWRRRRRPGAPVPVVVPDGVLRELGEPCSGGEPFLYVHATAALADRGRRPAGRLARATCRRARRSRPSTMIRGCRACRRSAASIRPGVSAGGAYRLVLPRGRSGAVLVQGREGDGGARVRWSPRPARAAPLLAGCGGAARARRRQGHAARRAAHGRDVRRRRLGASAPPFAFRCSTGRRWRRPGCGASGRWCCSSSPRGAAAVRPSRRSWRRWSSSYRDVVTFVGLGGQDKPPP